MIRHEPEGIQHHARIMPWRIKPGSPYFHQPYLGYNIKIDRHPKIRLVFSLSPQGGYE